MGEAKEAKATFNLESTPPTNCTGVDITGEGSSLQSIAHEKAWIPGFQGPGGFCFGKGTEPKVTYNGAGSSGGLAAWDFNGPDGVPFDHTRAFTASDEAPTASQLGNAEAAAGGSKALVIPVAQTSIGVVVNPPKGCTLGKITNKQLESVFRGNVKRWGQIDTATGAGCAGAPITRVVRPDGSGTTYQFKNYLWLISGAKLLCTEGSGKTWKELESIGVNGHPNTDWPENGVGGCKAGTLSSVVTAVGNGGANLVKKVNTTNGSIGYAALPDVEAQKGNGENADGDTDTVKLQNNGLVKLANATFAPPATETRGANCSAAQYTVPAAGRVGSGSGESVDWSEVFGAALKAGDENYPLCALTYEMALASYGKAGFSEGVELTVRDYLTEYVTATRGQEDIESVEEFYSALPTSPNVAKDVRGAARLAASKIGF
jgi:ABC-type phosphate transport system substrate-binding protein